MKPTRIQLLAREAVAEEVGNIDEFVKREVKRLIRTTTRAALKEAGVPKAPRKQVAKKAPLKVAAALKGGNSIPAINLPEEE